MNKKLVTLDEWGKRLAQTAKELRAQGVSLGAHADLMKLLRTPVGQLPGNGSK